MITSRDRSTIKVSHSLIPFIIVIALMLFLYHLVAAAAPIKSAGKHEALAPAAAVLTVTKDDGVSSASSVAPGDTIEYTVVIDNSGDMDALNTIFSDTIDANTTLSGTIKSTPLAFDDSYAATVNTELVINAANGVLQGAASVYGPDFDPDGGAVTAVPATGSSTLGGSYNLEATGAFTYTPPADTPGTDTFSYTITDDEGANDTATVSISLTGVDIEVTKTVDNASPNEGETIEYTVMVTNNGPDNATGVIVTDALPAGVTYVSDDQAGYTPPTWTIGNLNNGQSVTLNITATVDAGTAGTLITNTATVTAVDQTDYDNSNDSDEATITIPGADIEVTKTVDNATPNEGDTIVYTIIATNHGPDNATGVEVTDALPAGVTYVDDDQASYTPPTWVIGSINSGQSVTLNITATVDGATAGTTITNTASVSAADQADGNTGNNSDDAAISIPLVDIEVTKSVDNATPNEGETIVYTVVATNNGPDDATGVVVTDALPAGVTYVSDDQAGYTPPTWTIGNLNNGQSVTLNITATVDVGTLGMTITNTATLTAVDQDDNTPGNDSDTAVISSQNNPPTANPDTYNDVVGNTLFAVGVTPAGPVVTATGSVLSNDDDGGDGPASISIAAFQSTSDQGGAVTMQPDGTFTYLPPVGITGSDTFTYTVSDGAAISVGTVNLTISDMVWYIDNTAGAGDGRSTTPFNTLVAFNAEQGGGQPDDPEAGDIIFIYAGSGDYTGGITLLNDQQLIGHGVDLVVNSNTLVTASSRPTIANATGNGVTLAQDNTIRGLIVGDTPTGYGIFGNPGPVGTITINNAAITGTGAALNLNNATLNVTLDSIVSNNAPAPAALLVLNSSGNFTVTNQTQITAPGNFGITLNTNPTATFDFNTVDITLSSGGGALFGANTGTVNIDGGVISNTGGSGVQFNTTTLAATFTSVTVNNGPGNSIFLQDITGTTSIQNLSVAATTGIAFFADNADTVNVNAMGANSATVSNSSGKAIDITNTTVNMVFDSLSSINSPSEGVNLDIVSGSFEVTGVTTVVGAVSDAIDISAGSALFTFNSVDIDNPGDAGLSVNNLQTAGSLTITGGDITSASGAAVDVNLGRGAIIYGGTINNTTNLSVDITNRGSSSSTTLSGNITDSGSGINVSGNNVSTITFSGTSIDMDTGANDAITISSNTNSTINFTGDNLNILTTNAAGLTASSNGTVNITGANNVVNTTGGTAVSLTDTTIGAGGVTFLSVSADSADIGINLNNTGGGAFTITGSGLTGGSGGTITNINDRGLAFTTAQNISINNMNLTNATLTQDVATTSATCTDEPSGDNSGCNAPVYLNGVTNVTLNNLAILGSVQHGINGLNVTDLTLTNTDITGIGNEDKENGIHFINLLGNVTFNTLSVNGSDTRNVLIENNQGTAFINVVNSSFDNAVREDGFHLIGGSSGGLDATVTLTVTDSVFTLNNAVQLKAHAEDNSLVNVNITGNDFGGDPDVVGNVGIDLAARDSGTINFDVIGTGANPQTFQPIRSHNINLFVSGGGAASGTIDGNIINESRVGAGIRVVAEVTTSASPDIVVDISNNSISNVQGTGLAGIHIEARDGGAGLTGTADIDATVDNNTVSTNDADAAIQIYVSDLLAPRDNRTCVNVTNNNTTAVGGDFGPTDFFYGNDPGSGANTGVAEMQGFVTDIPTTWSNNGNVDSGGFVGGSGNPVTGGTCATVAAASSLAVVEATGREIVHDMPVKPVYAAKEISDQANLPQGGVRVSEVSLAIGTLPPGKSVTLTFTVVVNDPFPDGVDTVSNQGWLTADGLSMILSDDPETAAANDATVTNISLTRLTFLPIVMNDFAYLPDLVVSNIILASDNLTITLENIGPAPVTDAFWVDVYFDPDTVPSMPNQPWWSYSDEGLVWGVTQAALPLGSGEMLTLTIGDAYYAAAESNFSGTIADGTEIYVQVDSANLGNNNGAVLETHEYYGDPYNNIAQTTAVLPMIIEIPAALPASSLNRSGLAPRP